MVPTGRTVHALDRVGYVRDWLVGPCWSASCDDLDAVLDARGSPWGPDGRWVLTNGPDVTPLKRRLYARRALVVDQELPEVVEGGAVEWTAPGGHRVDRGIWRRVRTGRDGLVDWSAFCRTPEYRHALAATVLEVDQAESRTLEVASTGPFALWADDELLAVREDVGYMEPLRHRIPLQPASGCTRLLLATWQVAFRECRHVVAVRVDGLPVQVVLPSPGADEHASAVAEQVLDGIAVQSWALPDGVVRLRGPVGAALTVAGPDGAEVRVDLADGAADLPLTDLSGGADPAAHGEVELTVRVADARCPVLRTLRVAGLPHTQRAEPVGDDPGAWRVEVLQHVAAAGPGVARALARHAHRGAPLDAADLAPALEMLERRADCADFEALGLLHLWHRVPPDRWPPGGRRRVEAALRGFKYWIDQPGLDAMCYFTENHQLVWHTAELLAGEAFPTDEFANTGWPGSRHAEHGRERARAWMRRRLSGGFSEFDSNAYVAIDVLALVSLVELASGAEVSGLAEALLDKTLLTLAANSWRGIHGAAHGRSYVPTLRSSRLEETAPIMWALWGTGALNAAVLPATTLCLARRYRLPPLVRAVAAQPPEHWSGRQVYRGELRRELDLLARPYRSDLRVWRTRDAMLSSVQDYRAGLPGLQEHVWGATLGPEAQVFATAAAAATSSSSARPNAWAGQRVLPRVRQHRDTLIAVHDPAPLGTHVWFPALLMDEVRGQGSWLAGRVGDGYVAVAAAGGLRPATAGDEAHQAWRPVGDGLGYVATVGRRADDGPFARFVARLAEPEFTVDDEDDPVVRWRARDGRGLELGRIGPFLVDGAPIDLGPDGLPADPPHLDNPAVRVATGEDRLDARWAGHRLVLDLGAGRRLVPPSGVPGR